MAFLYFLQISVKNPLMREAFTGLHSTEKQKAAARGELRPQLLLGFPSMTGYLEKFWWALGSRGSPVAWYLALG